MNRKPWVIVLSIDRLGAGFLGPYGNTWLETPAFNRLASRSALLENLLTDSPDLPTVYRSYWQGVHALVGESTASSLPTLPGLLADAGLQSLLLSDDPSVAEHPLGERFSQRIRVPTTSRDAACDELEETQLAEFFSLATECIQRDPPDLVWLHSQGMAGAWDAPASFRNELADEDDPSPPELVAPPSRVLPRGFDPDELLGLTQAYAGQVAALDLCLETFLGVLEEHPRRDELLLIVTSPRGYPLGEHLRVGDADTALYGELLHVPALVRAPGTECELVRDAALAQPADLFATVLEWLGSPAPAPAWSRSWLPLLRGDSAAAPRQSSCSAAPTGDAAVQWALRTPAWFLTLRDERDELFTKPDDRWEVNDVASRCGDVVRQMRALLQLHRDAAAAGSPPPSEWLPDILRDAVD